MSAISGGLGLLKGVGSLWHNEDASTGSKILGTAMPLLAGFLNKTNNSRPTAEQMQTRDAMFGKEQMFANGGDTSGNSNIDTKNYGIEWKNFYNVQPYYTRALAEKYPNIPIKDILNRSLSDKSFSNANLNQYADSLVNKYGDFHLTPAEMDSVAQKAGMDIRDIERVLSAYDTHLAGDKANIAGTKEQGQPVNDLQFGPRMMLHRRFVKGNVPYKYLNNEFAEGGNLTEFDEGGSHEQNPNGGIPQGYSPNGELNTVEQGETKHGNYIFSDRRLVSEEDAAKFNLPKNVIGKTFAKASKMLDKDNKERPYDPISNKTSKEMLERLEEASEATMPDRNEGQEQYASGGGLSRSEDYGSSKKPYPSVASSDFAGSGRSYPIPTEADAVDALRLAGLHGRSDVKAKVYAKYPQLRHDDGGNMPMGYSNSYIYNMFHPYTSDPYSLEQNNMDYMPDIKVKSLANPLDNNLMRTDTVGLNPLESKSASLDTGLSNNLLDMTPETSTVLSGLNNTTSNGDTMLSKLLGNFKDNPMSALRYAPIAANLLGIDKPKQAPTVSLPKSSARYTPGYMDVEQMTSPIASQREQTIGDIMNTSMGSASSARAGILGADLNYSKAVSDAMNKISQYNLGQDAAAQQFNAQQDQFNIGQMTREQQINDQNLAAYNTAKSNRIQSLLQDIAGVGQEAYYKPIIEKTFGYSPTGKVARKNGGNIKKFKMIK
jgi:hypothetical protein